MPDPVSLSIGAGVAGSIAQGKAQKSAASAASAAELEAARLGIAENRRQFAVVRRALNPYIQSGRAGTDGFMALMGMGGARATDIALDRLKASGRFKALNREERREAVRDVRQNPRFSDEGVQRRALRDIRRGPEFNLMMSQGEEAILGNAAATGGLRGGDTQRALAEFRPAVLNTLVNQRLDRLGGLMTSGQNAAAGLGGAAIQTGQANAALYGNAGSAQAAGALARGRATSDMLSGLGYLAGDFISGQTAEGGGWRPDGLMAGWNF